MSLRSFLSAWHEDFGFRQIKEDSHIYQIDGQEKRDKPQLFCNIFVSINEDDTFELEFRRCPMDEELRSLIEDRGCQVTDNETDANFRFRMKITEITLMRGLAKQIRGLIRGSNRYQDRNWKWKCPRTAASLNRFADALWSYRKAYSRAGFVLTACVASTSD